MRKEPSGSLANTRSITCERFLDRRDGSRPERLRAGGTAMRPPHDNGFPQLARQRALPHPEQQPFELGEMLRSKLSAPFVLDVPENLVDLRVCGASAFGQADDSRAAFVGRVGPNDIPEHVEAPKELVHGL